MTDRIYGSQDIRWEGHRLRLTTGRLIATLPMIHRDGWAGPRTTRSSVAYGWYCWDRGHTGPATNNRISWTTEESRL